MAATDKGENEKDERKASARRGGGWRETVLLIAVGVVIALVLNAFVIGSFWIPSPSMENTLLEGDRVIANKLHGDAERGDIVVFSGWNGQDTIKRVIAEGGDTVECCDAQRRITVNGVPLDEKDYLHPDDFPSGDEFKEKVPPGRLWVMGDHRSASGDSRDHGTISQSQVIGRAVLIYWPISRIGVLSRPDVFDRVR